MSFPSDCPIGQTYYADAMDTGSIASGWTGDTSDIISSGGAYRDIYHHASGIDTDRILRRTIIAPTSIEATVGIDLNAYSASSGLDTTGVSSFAMIRVFQSGTSTEWFSFGIRYQSLRVNFPNKTYTLTLELKDIFGALYSSPILVKDLTAGDIPYHYTYSANIKLVQISTNNIELFLGGVSLGIITNSHLNMTDTFGVVLDEVSYGSSLYQEDYGWIKNYRAVAPSGMGSTCLGDLPSSFTISSTKIKVKPFPTYEIKPAYSFVQNSSGYWKGTDRGAAQDVYIGNFTAEATDTNFNDLQTTINSSREGITFSGFNTDLLAPNVDQTGSVVGSILDFGARKHLQFNGIGSSVLDINISFRALSPTVLSTTPSLSALRLMENWVDLHTSEVAKSQSLTQAQSYADRNSDSGRFVGYFSQTRAETQAILAYILITARAATIVFPTLSGVAYPFGISKGTGPFNVVIYDFKVTRQNLNRWKIMIDFRESV